VGPLLAGADRVGDPQADEGARDGLERREELRVVPAGDGEAVDEQAEDHRAGQRREEGPDDPAPEAVRHEHGEVPDGKAHHDPAEHAHG
jgi:hypothetical protein